MEKTKEDTMFKLWSMVKDILRSEGLFKFKSIIYRKAMSFEDELFNPPKSVGEQSNSAQQLKVEMPTLEEVNRHVDDIVMMDGEEPLSRLEIGYKFIAQHFDR